MKKILLSRLRLYFEGRKRPKKNDLCSFRPMRKRIGY